MKPECKNAKWTSTETQRLCLLLKKKKTYPQIAAILKRTVSSIQNKASGMRLSIRKNRPPFSKEEFNRRYEKHIAKGVTNVNAEA